MRMHALMHIFKGNVTIVAGLLDAAGLRGLYIARTGLETVLGKNFGIICMMQFARRLG